MNCLLKLISILSLWQIAVLLGPVDAASYRIIGGKKTTINKHKYIVSLRFTNGDFFCGGALVAKRYVVTAAHCMDGLKASNFYVHGGATHLTQSGVKRSVTKIVVPKAFNMQNVTMDVAVLKLSAPMVGRNIATIPLCSHPIYVNDWVTVSGWGLTNENGFTPSTQLRTVNVRLISTKKCRNSYRSVMKLSRTMMCASVPGTKDACTGDSGGPLVHKGQLCGIVSFGVGCARKNYPGVYTIVSYVKRFIRNAIKN